MIDEDTGKEPECLICGSVEDCEHLVAHIDLTFSECLAGSLCDRDGEFLSEITDAFLDILKSGAKKAWQNKILEQLWAQANIDYPIDGEHLKLEGSIYFRFLIELLEGADAISYPGPIIDEGGPGFSSSISILYADEPDTVVDNALKNLKLIIT